MIDLRLLRADPDLVRSSQRARGADPALVDALLAADESRRAAVTRADALRAEQKATSNEIRAAEPPDRIALMERARALATTVKEAEAAQADAEAKLREAHLAVPNVAPDAPPGGEQDYVVLREVGVKPDLAGPKDHLELGEKLHAIDTERGAKVSGTRFYYLTGVGALLELALVNLAMAQAVEVGLIPAIVPALVRREAMEGTGFLGEHAPEIYRLEADDLYLVGTSEVALAARHMNEIIDTPIRYAGYSTCFRREAGSYGKDTRGIIRVHQFDKVEMFSFTTVEESYAEHLRLLAWEEEFLAKLELPYRVIDVAAGDLGSSALRKFDCEAWLPSQQRWLELMSASNCTDFQARRLNIRTRGADRKARQAHVATLNGTLMASTRTIVALLENHQEPDGSVRVPKALQPYLGREVLEAP